VAYHLAVGSGLPRLGYVTFMDALFLIAFVLSVAAIACNVQLRRLQARRETDLAERLDRPMLLAYPPVSVAVRVGTALLILP
jgi:hypothetical protein